MDNFMLYGNDKIEKVDKINLDELYEKKQELDKQKLYTYNKILARIHNKIKLTSRQRNAQQYCWFVIPEVILGTANYDHAGCIAYIVEKLQENKFMVRYTHPNLLLISWMHYVPTYVRTEYKKKTGQAVDEFGNIVDGGSGSSSNSSEYSINRNGEKVDKSPADMNALLYNHGHSSSSAQQQSQQQQSQQKKEYTPINSYKPTGNLVYNQEFFKKLEDKIQIL